MTLSEEEFTVLMIAAQGEAMMPIGHWKRPTEHLVELGLLRKSPCAQDPDGSMNLTITPEGRKACQARDQEDQDALSAAMNAVVDNRKKCPHCGGTLE